MKKQKKLESLKTELFFQEDNTLKTVMGKSGGDTIMYYATLKKFGNGTIYSSDWDHDDICINI